MQGLGQFGSWFLKNRMQAAPLALTGLAAAAGIGFLSSKADPRGLYEGPLGGLGGGAAGGFSGAVLGGIAGAGILAAGMYSPAFRPAVGRWIGKALSSGPVQGMGAELAQAPLPGVGGQAIQAFGSMLSTTKFLTPQKEAASFLIQMLKNKQAKAAGQVIFGHGELLGVGAGVGALGGALAGGAGGVAVGAWRGGAQLSGPMNQTY